jgi:hypothetical protein
MITDYDIDVLQFLKRNGPCSYEGLRLFRPKFTVYRLRELLRQNYVKTHINKWGERIFERGLTNVN